MFIGHYGVGFASKRFAPRASLGVLVAAVSLLDLVWPVLVLTGIEVVRVEPGATAVTPLDFAFYPYSHSLLFVAIWAAAFSGFYFWRTRYRAGAVAIALGVVSHWVLDLVVHRPDLPLYPGSQRLGFGLWNHVAATVAVEGALFAIGVALYASITRAKNATGRWALWALVVLLAGSYAANLLGPPPPSGTAVAAVALLTWLFPFWAWWIDRNREVTMGAPADARSSRPPRSGRPLGA
jgi:membrane-bound metal-dependent hydrolase YbcI (DUF457 family)